MTAAPTVGLTVSNTSCSAGEPCIHHTRRQCHTNRICEPSHIAGAHTPLYTIGHCVMYMGLCPTGPTAHTAKSLLLGNSRGAFCWPAYVKPGRYQVQSTWRDTPAVNFLQCKTTTQTVAQPFPKPIDLQLPAPELPPMTARTHWLSGRPTGSSVVTSTSKGA
jgi:hypothetical protein